MLRHKSQIEFLSPLSMCKLVAHRLDVAAAIYVESNDRSSAAARLEYRNYLENAWWDIIVIDECHNVVARAGEQGVSHRARLARLLAARSDTMILLSATPHNGSARRFASLMSLLDPTAISDPDDYTPGNFRHKVLVVRRFKKTSAARSLRDASGRISPPTPKTSHKGAD